MTKIIALLLVAAVAACSKSDPIPEAPQAPQKLTAEDLKKIKENSDKQMDEGIRLMEEDMRKRKEAAHAKK